MPKDSKDERSVATEDAQRTKAGKQKIILSEKNILITPYL
jgi:hypothetical protein